MPDFVCRWDAKDFAAFNVPTGENRMVRVTGTGTCPQGGFDVGLDHGPIPIVPEPWRLHLRLVEDPPPAGTDALAEVAIDQLFEISDEVTEVAVLGVGIIPIQ